MKRFTSIFAFALGLFVLANAFSYFTFSDGHGVQTVYDGIQRAGFPSATLASIHSSGRYRQFVGAGVVPMAMVFRPFRVAAWPLLKESGQLNSQNSSAERATRS